MMIMNRYLTHTNKTITIHRCWRATKEVWTSHSWGNAWIEHWLVIWSPVSIQTHATQSLVLHALRKRKPQETQALDWLLRWLAVSIEHSYWLELAFVAWNILCNVFACVIFLRLLRFLRTFLTQSLALRALRLNSNRAWVPNSSRWGSKMPVKSLVLSVCNLIYDDVFEQAMLLRHVRNKQECKWSTHVSSWRKLSWERPSSCTWFRCWSKKTDGGRRSSAPSATISWQIKRTWLISTASVVMAADLQPQLVITPQCQCRYFNCF